MAFNTNLIFSCRKHQDRRRRELGFPAQDACDLIAVDIEHHHVGDDDIRLKAARLRNTALAILGKMHIALQRPQCMRHQVVVSGD